MYIGELAKKTGASRKAIYLYEALGLIQKPNRRGNYRVYCAAAVAQIEIIRCAQALGFQLKELVAAVGSSKQSNPGLEQIIAQIQSKRETMQARILAAQAQLELLNQLEKELLANPEALQCNSALDLSPKGKL